MSWRGLNLSMMITILVWGINFAVVKEIYQFILPGSLYLIRFLLMWLGIWTVAFLKKELIPIKKVDKRKVLYFGFVNQGLYMCLFLLGLHYASAAVGAILIALSPLLTSLGNSFISRSAINPKTIFGSLIAVSGVGLVVFKGLASGGTTFLGVAILFSASILWAYAAIIAKPLLEIYTPMRLFSACMPGALVVALPVGLVPTVHSNWFQVPLAGWLSLIFLVFGSGVIGFYSFFKGVKEVGSEIAVSYQYFTPVVAGIVGWIWFGSQIFFLQLVGMGLVIGGLFIANPPKKTLSSVEYAEGNSTVVLN